MDINLGALEDILGVWQGDKGMDIAPDPDGTEENPYYETITFSSPGDLTNADKQVIAMVHYRQIVQRKSDNGVFHDETGYWMWDAASQTIMHSLVIPRAVCVLAGGKYTGQKDADGNIILEVSARHDDPDWGILQSPFMKKNAKTISFDHKITLGKGKLSYFEKTVVDIYGKVFEHTDQNELVKQS